MNADHSYAGPSRRNSSDYEKFDAREEICDTYIADYAFADEGKEMAGKTSVLQKSAFNCDVVSTELTETRLDEENGPKKQDLKICSSVDKSKSSDKSDSKMNNEGKMVEDMTSDIFMGEDHALTGDKSAKENVIDINKVKDYDGDLNVKSNINDTGAEDTLDTKEDMLDFASKNKLEKGIIIHNRDEKNNNVNENSSHLGLKTNVTNMETNERKTSKKLCEYSVNVNAGSICKRSTKENVSAALSEDKIFCSGDHETAEKYNSNNEIILLSPITIETTKYESASESENKYMENCFSEMSSERNHNCQSDKRLINKFQKEDDCKESDNKKSVLEDGHKTIDSSTTKSIFTSDVDNINSMTTRRKRRASTTELLIVEAKVKKAKKHASENEPARNSRGTYSSGSNDMELLLEPFKHGWMRELVYRSTGNTACDTYYFTPEGKKLRSLVQVADYLNKSDSPLGVANFSFSRRLLHKPPFEVVRQAGRVGMSSKKLSQSPVAKLKFTQSSTSKSKRSSATFTVSIPDAKLPETTLSLPHRQTRKVRNKCYRRKKKKCVSAKYSDVEVIIERDSDEVVLSSLGIIENISSLSAQVLSKVNTSTSATTAVTTTESKDTQDTGNSDKNVVLIKKEQSVDVNISALLNSNVIATQEHSEFSEKKMVARKSTTPRPKSFRFQVTGLNRSESETTSKLHSNQLCTLACPGLESTPPTLQCARCICLFHPECVNYKGDRSNEFLCLFCVKNRNKNSDVSKSKSANNTLLFSNHSTKTTSEIQSAVTHPLQLYHTEPTSTSPSLSLYTLKLAPNNSLVTVDEIETLQNQPDISSIIHLPYTGGENSSFQTSFDNRTQSSVSVFGPLVYSSPQTQLISTVPATVCTSVSAVACCSSTKTSITASMPTLISAGVLSADLKVANKSSFLSMVIPSPPKLTLAPGAAPPVPSMSVDNEYPNTMTTKPSNSNVPLNAQLLTLPKAVTKRLKLSQPLALKINSIQVVVPPSCVIGSGDGLKVLLPPNTFPLPTDPNQKLSVTVSNNPEPEVKKPTEPLSKVTAENCEKELSPVRIKTRTKIKGINPAACFIKKLYGGYDCMLEIFKYLKTSDLLRVSHVCQTWRKIAKQPCLWQSVSLRGLIVKDWDKATLFFKEFQLKSLSLLGMCHDKDENKIWHGLMSTLCSLNSLTTLEFGLVPASVLHRVCERLTGLEVLRAKFITDAVGNKMWSTPSKLYMGKFAHLKNLRELKLRGVCGLVVPSFSFSGGLMELGSLKKLISLTSYTVDAPDRAFENLRKTNMASLTTMRDIPDSEFHFLQDMKQLKELELGDCTVWSSEIYFILGELSNLTKLRLECGGEIPDIGLGDMLLNLKKLEILELIMYQVADSFENVLHQLEKLHSLVIWPDTTTDAAALVNFNTLAAVGRLKNLQHLEWGVVNSESDQQNGYINILPQCRVQTENMVLPSEKISINQLTDKLCELLPQVNVNVVSSKIMATP